MKPLDNLLRVLGHSLGLPDNYGLLKCIGKGAEGEVWQAADMSSNRMVAVKLVPRGCPHWQVDMVRREACMLARLGYGHVNIVRPVEMILTTKHFAVVMELVAGGSLSSYLSKHKVDEPLAAYLFRQLGAAIGHCHAHRMAFRDVKPNNLLLTKSNPPILKLCDFGLAQTWAGRDDPLFTTLAGTPGYMSPEIMRSFVIARDLRRGSGSMPDEATYMYNGIKADVYSMGVMLCVMLLHHMPWEYDRFAERLPSLEAMRAAWAMTETQGLSWRTATPQTHRLSEPLLELLDGMLQVDAAQRWDLERCMAHPWVQQELPPAYTAALEALAAAQARIEEAEPRFGPPQLEARLEVVEGMVAQAGTKGKGFKLIQRLNMTRPLPASAGAE